MFFNSCLIFGNSIDFNAPATMAGVFENPIYSLYDRVFGKIGSISKFLNRKSFFEIWPCFTLFNSLISALKIFSKTITLSRKQMFTL